MATQKIVNLLNSSDNKNSKFATKKWYVIDRESKGNYSQNHSIKFLTKSIESSDYSDAYILVTGNITLTKAISVPACSPVGTVPQRKQELTEATQVAFKNCAPFKDCRTEINDTSVDYAYFINITMPMYNLSEYSDNYSDTSGSLWDFRRDEIDYNANLTNDNNASSFKYKANLIGNTEIDGRKKGVKIALPLKYLSNFWRLLEIPLINCKVEFSLKWIENCVLTSAAISANANATGADSATFKITNPKFYAPIVTLSAEDNVKLSKLLGEGYKRSIYWNKYKVIDNKVVEIAANYEKKYIRELLAADLSKQKALDEDSRPIQQIIFAGKIKATEGNTRNNLEISKETMLEFAKETTKVL